MLNTILLITTIVLLIVAIVILIMILKRPVNVSVKNDIERVEKAQKEEISRLKTELDTKFVLMQGAINDSVNKDLSLFKDATKDNIENVGQRVKENTEKVEKYLDSIRNTLENSIQKLQEDNNKKLEEMRKTVDEKLDRTLNDRLTQSFKLVQDNLNAVSEGLGEMRNLATGVGDLKKVLTNVKTRGIWGEMQLSQILGELLTKEQYDENIITKPKSKDPVEFAIKLPGDGNTIVRLPIDSKFPLDTYSNLLEAYDTLDKEKIDDALKLLKERIKKAAKDISDKYIEPPFTTDFGIMFLPIEGLYAEVAKSGVIEELQNKYRIIVAGPTTMSALLNSLQVGFRTLAIQKRSSEVWNILSAVKTEFNTFSDALKAAQKKIQQADKDIETLVGTRTRVMQSKLKGVTELDYKDAAELLDSVEE